MIVIGANMGITKMSREHIGLAYSLKIPTFFVVTKIDIAPPNILEKTVDTLKNIIKSPAAGRKLPILIQNESIE